MSTQSRIDPLMVSSMVSMLRANPHGMDLRELADSFAETPRRMRELVDYVWALEFFDADGQVDPTQAFDFDADGLDDDEPWVKLTHAPVPDVPRTFSADEMALVLTGLDVLRETATVDEASRIDELHAQLRGATTSDAPANHDPQLELLRGAIDAGRQVRLQYIGEFDDAPLERRIDPLRLESRAGLIYLNAYCHLREGLRWFRSDRILQLEVLEKSSGTHSEADRDRALAVTGHKLIPVRIALRAAAAAAIRPYLGSAALPKPDADGWMRATVRLRSAEVAARLAAEHAGDVVIEGPEDVRTLVTHWLHAALAKVDSPDGHVE